MNKHNQYVPPKFWMLGCKHLEENQMHYLHHARHGIFNGLWLLVLAISSIIHAIFPWVLKFHAAKGVIAIFNDMKRFSHLHKLINDNTFDERGKK